MTAGKRMVFLGGGTGLSVLLKGVKRCTDAITAIVAVSDDGGSSGILRQELGIPATGDLRNCLVALAETESLMELLFQHRFYYGHTMQGHSLGNLLLAAMTEITGDFASAIQKISQVLKVRGKVLPATLDHVHLGAIMADKSLVYGETAIREHDQPIERVFLIPGDCRALPEAVESIRQAEVIVMGPGSLYSSILPPLLVEDIRRALVAAPGKKVYVSNIMTEHGETDRFTAADHVRALTRHVREAFLDCVIVNEARLDRPRLSRYRLEAAAPVDPSADEIRAMGIQVVAQELIASSGAAWHDPNKLARLIMSL